MIYSNHYIQACMKAWLHCENLLISITQKEKAFSIRTKKVLDECAQICLATMHALKSSEPNVQQLALLCVGICEECAEVCERYPESQFLDCAAACRQCSSGITKIASAAV